MINTYNQLIIGSGFAGLCAAINLKKQGESNFIILERNAHLGGTWYDNHYPGAACDVESHLYSFSFEPNPDWSREFGPQQEILKYMEHCAAKYDVAGQILYNQNVKSAVFNETEGTWSVETEKGEKYSAKVIISCSGGLSQPMYPDIKGLNDFKGQMFHSAKWDNTFKPKGKTVAVIGTGASAIQIVPTIAPDVKQLYLFQRTPPWVMPKPDGDIGPVRKWLYKNLSFTQRMHRSRLYWQHELMAIGFIKNQGLLKLGSKLALRYLKRTVPDDKLRAKLTPNYTMGCKRVLISNEYYPSLTRTNVEVVTDSIAEINATGVLTKDGHQRNVDAIIIATGFQASEQVSRFAVKGRNGADLNEVWKDGAEAYLGTTVAGFPNMFLVVGPNTGLGHSSMLLMIEAQVNLIMESLKALKQKGAKYIDLKPQVQRDYNNEIQSQLANTVWQNGGCVSWYQMRNGKNVTLWPGFTFTFMKRTKKFEEEKYEIVS
ncbi:MAG TPA: NAD(P)/FAD-dependent oxidoreductase [Chitinophagales bacterium]|nr:NAD(P)/FAD-dependent oxidoreductase [Chitinophagales bacterium]